LPRLRTSAPFLFSLLLSAIRLSAQLPLQYPGGTPTPGDYKPPALSFFPLINSDKLFAQALSDFQRTHDSAAYLKAIQSADAAGDMGIGLLLAENYVPDRCHSEPDRDYPNCANQEAPPKPHPFNITPSYEEAAKRLERLSAQGSGEASEVLAQLITRMLAIGHSTTFTAADSARFHALARSQGFDMQRIEIHCYRNYGGDGPLHITGVPTPAVQLTSDQLRKLRDLGLHGELALQGEPTIGTRTILSHPDGPTTHIAVILDHHPEHEVHLRLPVHGDAIYVQRGDAFVLLPKDAPTLSRTISIMPGVEATQQIMLYAQNIDGIYTGGFCARW
jgi:hypothetical protein